MAHLLNAEGGRLFGAPSVDQNYPHSKNADATMRTYMNSEQEAYLAAQGNRWWARARATGQCGEACAADWYRQLGYEVYDGVVTVATSEGIRYPDLAVRQSPDSPWSFVEVKANTSPLIRSQVVKDRWIESNGYRGLQGPEGMLGAQGPTGVNLVRVLVE
jgi:hypothetical protein